MLSTTPGFTITASPTTADVGSDVTYTVKLHNPSNGNYSIVDSSVTDVIPTGTTFVSASSSGDGSWAYTGVTAPPTGTGTGTLDFSQNNSPSNNGLFSGDTETFTIVLQINPGDAPTTESETDSITNAVNASLSYSGSGSGPSTVGPVTADVTVNGPTTVLLTQTTTPAVVGGLETVTLTASNIGGHNAGNVAIDYAGSENYAFSSASYPSTPSGITETDPGAGSEGDVTFNIPVLPAGDSVSVQVTMAIPSDAETGTAQSDATVTSPTDLNSPHNSDATFNISNPQVDLVVTKTASNAGIITAGATAGADAVTYTMMVSNSGPAEATGLTLSDVTTIEPGVTVTEGTPSTGSFVGTNGTGTWLLGNLADGSTAMLKEVVTVGSSAAAGTNVIGDTISVNTVNQPQSSVAGDAATAFNSVAESVDVGVSKTDNTGGTGSVTAGQGIPGNLLYTVSVSNNGPSDATGVVVSDAITLEKGISLNSIVPSQGTFSIYHNTVTWILGTLPAGGPTQTLILTLTVGPSAAPGLVVLGTPPTGPVGDTATVTAENQTDTGTLDKSASDFTAVLTSADLQVAKAVTGGLDTNSNAVAGTNLTYTIAVTNAGPSDAQSVTMTDTLPTGTTLVSLAQNTPPNCPKWTITSGTATLATLPAGASTTFTYVVTVNHNDLAGFIVSNTATVGSSSTPDPNTSNNTSIVTTTVDTQAGLSVIKQGPASVVAGSAVIYTYSVTNTGPSDAAGVTLTDSLPANANFVSESLGSNAVSAGFSAKTVPALGAVAGTIVWSDTSFAAGASATFTVILTTNGSVQTQTNITNSAAVATTDTFNVLTPPASTTSSVTTTLLVAGVVTTQTDPFNPALTDLVIRGNNVAVGPVTTGGATGVVADGKVYYPTWPTGRILIFGGSASYSVIEVSPLVTTPTYIFGGPGNYDSLAAGGGPTVIVGGGGSHDTLTSLSGRDVLIAGTGSATLDAAGTSQDMLVGGTTAFNSNQAILNAVLTEWNSSATYAVRVAAELAAYGSQIHSSGVADILYGNVSSTSPGNWFLRSSLDSDYLVKSSETVTPIV